MAHTLPPWTTKYRMTQFFGTIDNAELAARLGSINTFDRRGNVVYADDFHGSIYKYQFSSSGAGADYSKSNLYPYQGDACLVLTGGSDGQKNQGLLRYFYLPQTTKMGLEWIYTAQAFTSSIRIDAVVLTGVYQYQWSAIADYANSKFSIYTDAGFVDVPGGSKTFEKGYYNYTPFKLVFDVKTGKYIRLLYGNSSYDLSDYTGNRVANAATPYIMPTFIVFSTAGNNATARLGGFIFTQGEI